MGAEMAERFRLNHTYLSYANGFKRLDARSLLGVCFVWWGQKLILSLRAVVPPLVLMPTTPLEL